jgi:phosphate transport system substrate-binding protein
MKRVRALIAGLALACLASAPQATPPAAKPAAPASPAQPSATPSVATAGASAMQGWYTAEVSAEVAKFPEYIAKAPSFTGSLRIVGSNAMAPLLAKIASSYESVYPGLKVSVKQGGSTKGIEALRAGQCDLAAVSRSLTPSEIQELEGATGLKVFEVPVALDATCIYVNADNPLPGITRDQLNGIFAITHSLTKDPIVRWNELDPRSPLGDRFMPIHVLPMSHGTMQRFQEFAMPGEDLQTVMRYFEPGPSSVVNACCAYPQAMGIAGYANRQPRARMLPVSEGRGKPFVEPSFATIRDRSYPMWRPLNLVVLAKDASSVPALTLDFLKFIWSESGQDSCAQLGVVVVDIDRAPEVMKPFVGQKFTGTPKVP